ncbi:SMI1/KNR4 family protein [Nocardiopsis lambiniae]|uniref:SMI1/KNR4 family protein n=1 Tax=Nocardiopsis lambiniae TaxID=3075539 RepID=A0ABU2M2V6_9ACTN|nr:SMI1/KNR4 family protein [Nocardiopsis sp. DSM 44743]MDT0326978.1 SMI1/KNR4 family protein [Nocardiopsis sp. DSM 44743]
MSWVGRIVDAVEWEPRDIDIAWDVIEERLGTPLPADYKELCRCFGVGEFSGYLHVYGSPGGTDSQLVDRSAALWRVLEEHSAAEDVFGPYGVYRPGGKGLIRWGMSVTAAEFCWAADAKAPPEDWPVVAREEAGDWQLLPMSASECLFRVLTDVTFEDFTVADMVDPPFFTPYEA